MKNIENKIKESFKSEFGFNPVSVKFDGSFAWADQVGYSIIKGFIIRNGLANK